MGASRIPAASISACENTNARPVAFAWLEMTEKPMQMHAIAL
jgi:hypothetical protein